MTAFAQPSQLAVRATPCPLTVHVVESPESISSEWRSLEAEGSASPYQRLDWVKAFAEAVSESGQNFRILVLRDPTDRTVMILPMLIRRSHGLTVAAPVGGRHANFHMPLTAMMSFDPDLLMGALQETGQRLRVDLFAFVNLPRVWNGNPNALAAYGTPSPSNAYGLVLEEDPEATFRRAFSKDARKHLRQKERYLGQLGHVSDLHATDATQADEILTAFYAMRRERFRRLGIANEFDRPDVQHFLRNAALAGLERNEPALELSALRVGERIVAVFGAAVDHRQASGMIIAFDGDPAIARCSPGELLLSRVIRRHCEAGRTFFDLGVGEARYKNSVCDTTIELVDAIIPVSVRGRAAAAVGAAVVRAKRRVKQTPWLWQSITRMRALQARAKSD